MEMRPSQDSIEWIDSKSQPVVPCICQRNKQQQLRIRMNSDETIQQDLQNIAMETLHAEHESKRLCLQPKLSHSVKHPRSKSLHEKGRLEVLKLDGIARYGSCEAEIESIELSTPTSANAATAERISRRLALQMELQHLRQLHSPAASGSHSAHNHHGSSESSSTSSSSSNNSMSQTLPATRENSSSLAMYQCMELERLFEHEKKLKVKRDFVSNLETIYETESEYEA